MTGWLCDMSKLEAEDSRSKVVEVYVKQGFPPDFRTAMNETLLGLHKWHTMTPSNRQIAFGTVWKLYRSNLAEYSTSLPEKTNSQLYQKFDQCVNAELSLKIKPKKTASKSSRSTRPMASQSVISSSGTGAGRGSHLIGPTMPSSASSVTMKSATSSGEQSIADIVFMVEEQINGLKGMDQNKFFSEAEKAFKSLKSTFSHLTTAVCCWKRQQQYLANHFDDDDSKQNEDQEPVTVSDFTELQNIGENAQSVSEVLYRLLDITDSCILGGWDNFGNLRHEIASSIMDLARICLIVTRQPDQVLKKENKFGVTVSLLAGWRSKAPNRAVNVSAQVYTEEELKGRSLSDPNWTPSSSKISINSAEVALEPAFSENDTTVLPKKSGAGTKRRATEKKKELVKSAIAQKLPMAYHADFVNVSWNKPEQERRNVTNVPCVTDLKYALVFEVEWYVARDKYEHRSRLRCMSLPITCVVHVNQELRARGTIFWDNAFAAYSYGPNPCECRRRLPLHILQSKATYESASNLGTTNTNGFYEGYQSQTSMFSVSGVSQVTMLHSRAQSVMHGSAVLSNGSSDSGSLFGDGKDGGGHHYCRFPFVTPETVGWSVFKRELNRWFESQTKCKLSEEHLEFVKRCVVQQTDANSAQQPGGSYTGGMVASVTTTGVEFHSSQPSVEPRVARSRVLTDAINEPIQSSSFWSWLYGLKKLIVDGGDPLVSFLWREGLIHFITHEEAIKKLQEKPSEEVADTMLIRFCNSERTKNPNQATANRGAIVITQGYHMRDPSGAPRVGVRSLEPWNAEILKKMDLQRRLASDMLIRSTIYPKEQGSWERVLEEYCRKVDADGGNQKNAAQTDQSNGNTEYVPTENECVPNDPSEDAAARLRMRRPTADNSTDDGATPTTRRTSSYYDSLSPASSLAQSEVSFVSPLHATLSPTTGLPQSIQTTYALPFAQPLHQEYGLVVQNVCVPQNAGQEFSASNSGLTELIESAEMEELLFTNPHTYDDSMGTSYEQLIANLTLISTNQNQPSFVHSSVLPPSITSFVPTTFTDDPPISGLYSTSTEIMYVDGGQPLQNPNTYSLNMNQANGMH